MRRRFDCFCVVLCLLIPTVASAEDLFRLYFDSVPAVSPGEEFVVTLRLDNGIYPATGSSTEGHYSVSAFAFGIALPDGISFEQISLEGTVLETVLGDADPFFGAVQEVSGGITVAVVLSDDLQMMVPEGLFQPLLKLVLSVPDDAETGSVALHVAGGLGTPKTDMLLATPRGNLRPHVRSRDVSIQSNGAPVSSLPTSPQMPTPTDAELVVDWFTSAEGAESGGSSAASGPGGTGLCEFDVGLGGSPEDVFPTYDVVSVSEDPMTNALQDAIDDYLAGGLGVPDDQIIAVEAGTFDPITIDTDLLRGDLIIYSVVGPGPGPKKTTIDRQTAAAFRCVTITGSTPPAAGRLFFGWSELDDFQTVSPFEAGAPNGAANARGWRGFELVNGFTVPAGFDGGGILIDSVAPSVQIRGCHIHDCYAPTGGGIAVIDSDDVQIVLNDISSNTANSSGNGIHHSDGGDGNTIIGRNFIHDNVAQVALSGPIFTTRPVGGGIYAERGDIEICSNQIYSNEARRGCGVYYGFEGFTNGTDDVVYLEDNDIFSNFAENEVTPTVDVGFLGGGVYIGLTGSNFPPVFIDRPDNNTRRFGMLRNRIHDNSIDTPIDPGPPPTELGGGVFIEVELGVPGIDPVGSSFFIGNTISDNVSVNSPAGVYLGAWTDIPNGAGPLVFFNNIIARNIDTAGSGTGLYIPFGPVPQIDYLEWFARNNIVAANVPAGDEIFAECDPAGGPVALTPFEFSHIQDENPAGCAGAVPEVNLFGTTPLNNDTTDPDLSNNMQDPDGVHISEISTCRDSGQDPVGFFDPTLPPFDREFDQERRVYDIIDRGADEKIEFRRGDADNDGNTHGLIDGLYILNFQFTMGRQPPCMDAADTDGDDVVNGLTDGLYLLNWYFAGGPQPPAPGPFECGPDDTSFDLLTCREVICPGP